MITFHQLILIRIIMYSWRLRSCLKWITLTLLMAIIARFKANECINRAFEHIYEGGPPLTPDEILSSHSVGGSADVAAIKCFSLCKNVGKCVGFNVKASFNDENCQLTNVTESKNKNTSKKGEWKLFRDFEALGQLKKQIQSQETKIQKLERENQDILKRFNRLQTPSCSALLIKHPSTRSGLYHLNPQGLSSSPLVHVYCNMTSKNGVGVTMIGHDSGSRTLVNGSEAPGSYKRKIKYDISMEQILAIVKQSKNCEQFIKYECYGSGLWFSTPYGWWVSRQGTKMKYWGGAAVNSGKCACGITNSCAGGWKCNCDRNDLTWREDSGYLTDKNTLPVTELNFGDAGDHDEKGYHTLEKLRCWG